MNLRTLESSDAPDGDAPAEDAVVEDEAMATATATEAGAPAGAAAATATTGPTSASRPVSIPMTCLSAFLASSGAGWMAAGLFSGVTARAVAVLGAALGVGVVLVSYRTRKPAIVQALVVPLAAVVGALLLLPFASGTNATLPGLVDEALRNGGLGQPPVPFDPGWRFVLVVFAAVLAAAASSLAVGLDRPRLSLLIPLPLLFVAALVQPSAGAFVSSGVSLLLIIGALVVTYGIDLRRDGATSGEFEVRRLARGAGIVAVVVAVIAGVSQAGFLFPSSSDELVIPPQRPRPQPAPPDRPVFTVSASKVMPWRLGVLDVYDGEAWLTAPVRGSALIEVSGDADIPRDADRPDAETVRATFTLADLPGRVLPGLAMPLSVESSGADVLYDQRTQALRLAGTRPGAWLTYTVTALASPSKAELAAAPAPSDSVRDFLDVPPPPPEVADLLAQAPQQSAFARLQFVREAFYRAVVAAGEGNPMDLPPARVVELLKGKEASPFEITAAEALLARWAGVPSRIGFGYFGGQPLEGEPDTLEVRPRNGATWLETYFEGYGWVPIVGTPPRAKGSLGDGVKNPDAAVQTTEELALVVYVPLESESIRHTYVVARYWLLVLLPYVVALGLLLVFFPGLVKTVRRSLRRRWGARVGPRGRIGVAYAELRDTATDFNIGTPAMTPVDFLSCLEDDAEHTELAWLVTRTLWGDLTRDIRPEDVEACEEMGRSVRRRLIKANPATSRVIAFASKASLRNPYSPDMPNPWRERPARRSARRGARATARAAVRALRPPWRRPAAAHAALAVAAILAVGSGFTACGERDGDAVVAPVAQLPDDLTPDAVGPFRIARADALEGAFDGAGPASLVDEGRVFTVHEGTTIQASVQLASFKTSLGAPIEKVQEGVRRSIATGRFQRTRIGIERVWALDLPEQRFLLWFSPEGRYYQLMVARRQFSEADKVFAGVIAHQRGDAAPTRSADAPPPPDPRRGLFAKESTP